MDEIKQNLRREINELLKYATINQKKLLQRYEFSEKELNLFLVELQKRKENKEAKLNANRK